MVSCRKITTIILQIKKFIPLKKKGILRLMNKNKWYPFRQIRWKLTATYMLITLCVFFTTELILTVSSTRKAFLSENFANSLFQLSLQEGRNLLPFLRQEEINQNGLQRYIDQRFPFRNRPLPSDKIPPAILQNQDITPVLRLDNTIPTLESTYSSSKSTIIITDENGFIQATNRTEKFQIDENIFDFLSTDEAVYLTDVLDQELFAGTKYFYENTQTLYLAVPLIERFQLEGVIYMQIYSPSYSEILRHSFEVFYPRIPVLFLVSAIVGFLFGFLSARSITKRLDLVTKIAERWGAGDFSARINEQQLDEVGQLTRDLDLMADSFENLLQSKEQLAMLEERNRLARDLHDSVKQQLFAVNMTLAAVAALWKKHPDQAYERLEVTRNLSQQAQDELSDLIRTLRPLELSDTPLDEAIQEYLKDWKRQTHIAAVLEHEGAGDLSPEVEKSVYRIFQEALSNIARHSNATAISVSIKFSARQMELVIHDNGSGFNLKDVKRGIGLNSMRERAESCGGQFELNSTSNGTKIRITIPLQEEEGDQDENE